MESRVIAHGPEMEVNARAARLVDGLIAGPLVDVGREADVVHSRLGIAEKVLHLSGRYVRGRYYEIFRVSHNVIP